MIGVTRFVLFLLSSFFFLPVALGFGAGSVSKTSTLRGKAFRHGDICKVLASQARFVDPEKKERTGFFAPILNIVDRIKDSLNDKASFREKDINRVYFGNWLRDYSQAMDVTGLNNASPEIIVFAVKMMSFFTFGVSSGDFKVDASRLGVYQPVEHIDNPKGYADMKPPPRDIFPKLRGPLDPREVDVDSKTGMKNYIAHEGETYDTSAAFIRRSLKEAIRFGRTSKGKDSGDLSASYRSLGSAMHTLEDFLSHSNWVELALQRMGHLTVFPYVGRNVTVITPDGTLQAPLVTGTFGGPDFIFSLFGEAQDRLAEITFSSVENNFLEAKVEAVAKGGADTVLNNLKDSLKALDVVTRKRAFALEEDDILFQQAHEFQKRAEAFDRLTASLGDIEGEVFKILEWRDKVEDKLDGIKETVDTIKDWFRGVKSSVNDVELKLKKYTDMVLEPFLKPVLDLVAEALRKGSRKVINSVDQRAIFFDDNASDPSHSQIAKDHFVNILNEPAGRVAKAIGTYVAQKIVQAWSDESIDIDATINDILQTIHHPAFTTGAPIQVIMLNELTQWKKERSSDFEEILRRLTKESVRDGRNRPIGSGIGARDLEDDVHYHHHHYSYQEQGQQLGPSREDIQQSNDNRRGLADPLLVTSSTLFREHFIYDSNLTADATTNNNNPNNTNHKSGKKRSSPSRILSASPTQRG